MTIIGQKASKKKSFKPMGMVVLKEKSWDRVFDFAVEDVLYQSARES